MAGPQAQAGQAGQVGEEAEVVEGGAEQVQVLQVARHVPELLQVEGCGRRLGEQGQAQRLPAHAAGQG